LISGLIYGQYPTKLFDSFSINSLSGLPLIIIFPSVNTSSDVRHLNVVVLPAPFTPNKMKHSSFFRLNDIPRTAFFIP